MNQESRDSEVFLHTLSENLPSVEDERRVRKGLLEKGAAGLAMVTSDSVQAASHSLGMMASSPPVAGTGIPGSGAAVSGGSGSATTAGVSGGATTGASGAGGLGAGLSVGALTKVLAGTVLVVSGAIVSWHEFSDEVLPTTDGAVRTEGAHRPVPEGKTASHSPVDADQRAPGPDEARELHESAKVDEPAKPDTGRRESAIFSESGEVGASKSKDEKSREHLEKAAAENRSGLGAAARNRPGLGAASRSGGEPGEGRAAAHPKDASSSRTASGSGSLDDTLAREAALLRGALRHIQQESWARARRDLARHERRFPAGALAVEREKIKAQLERARASGSGNGPQ